MYAQQYNIPRGVCRVPAPCTIASVGHHGDAICVWARSDLLLRRSYGAPQQQPSHKRRLHYYQHQQGSYQQGLDLLGLFSLTHAARRPFFRRRLRRVGVVPHAEESWWTHDKQQVSADLDHNGAVNFDLEYFLSPLHAGDARWLGIMVGIIDFVLNISRDNLPWKVHVSRNVEKAQNDAVVCGR